MTVSSALIAELLQQGDRMRHDLLVDVLQSSSAAYWLRRANDFEAAKPSPGDYPGEAMLPELRDQWRRAHETAKACRNRATLALVDDWSTEVDAAVTEVEHPDTDATEVVA